MLSTICNYFSNHHGVIYDKNRNNFKTGYSVMSKKKIKGFKIQNSKSRDGDQILRSYFKKKVWGKKDQRKLRPLIRVLQKFLEMLPKRIRNFLPDQCTAYIIKHLYVSYSKQAVSICGKKMSTQNQVFERVSGKKSQTVLNTSKNSGISRLCYYSTRPEKRFRRIKLASFDKLHHIPMTSSLLYRHYIPTVTFNS